MSKLSRCSSLSRKKSALTPKNVVAVLAGAGVLLGLGVAQLYLQFSLSDARQETTRLQMHKLELQTRINRLRSDVARLKQGDRLIEYARQLGMVNYELAEVERIEVDGEIRERYAVAMAQRSGRSEEPAPGEAERFGRLLASLGLEGTAAAEAGEFPAPQR